MNEEKHKKFITHIESNDLESVKQCLNDNEIDPGYKKNCALILAASLGHTEIVRILLERKFQVNPADCGNSALILASKNGHIDIVRLLLDNKMVNPTDCGDAPLWNAVMSRHVDIVRLLLAIPTVNASVDNNNLIRVAAKNNDIAILDLLLNRALITLSELHILSKTHYYSKEARQCFKFRLEEYSNYNSKFFKPQSNSGAEIWKAFECNPGNQLPKL